MKDKMLTIKYNTMILFVCYWS